MVTLLVSACSETVVESTRPTRQLPDYSYQEPVSSQRVKSLPWEVWAPFQDLSGKRLSNRDILLGDELLVQGKRRSALDAYLKNLQVALLPREFEASTLRIASQYLALNQPKKALSTVSAYFKQRGLGEEQVDGPFSLLLAYAYGTHNEADQALAWFSKAYRQAKGSGPTAESARVGVGLYLGSLSSGTFEQVAINWRSDSFINESIGRERARRASRAYDPDDLRTDAPFWVVVDNVSAPTDATPVKVAGNGKADGPIGVILSLSDRFGSLGRDTRQGFELAVAADQSGTPLRVETRDVGADTAAASAAVRELAGSIGTSVIVGPLLTEAATAAAETAREVNVPLIALSKSENFKSGGNIFRLGATSSSQIDALLTVAAGGYGLSRVAVVAPQSASGSEYTQALRRKVGSLGLALVFEGTYPSVDDATMATLAQQVEASGADAVLLPDTIEASTRFLTALSPQARKKMRPLGTALWDSAVKIANSQAVFERALFVTPFFPQSNRAVVKQFVESYRGKYHVTPNFLAAQGFDVGTVVVAAMRQAQRDGSTFKEALSHLPPYDGTTGYISVVPPGDIRRSMYVVEVTRDTFIERSGAEGADRAEAPKNYTFRGNQQVDTRTDEVVRETDAKVASGY